MSYRWILALGRYAFLGIVMTTFCTQELRAAANNSTLNKKIIVGYQGWFSAEPDSSPRNDWNHWELIKNGKSLPAVDMWPDITEYTNLYNREWKLRNGNSALMFSSWDLSTVRTHFQWMRTYNIDGAFVGRQTATVRRGGARAEFRNQVLKNVKNAAGATGRVFYINYDISEDKNQELGTGVVDGGPNVLDFIYDDFSALLSGNRNFNGVDYRGVITNNNGELSNRYLKHNGKPVIRIFGIGSKRNSYDLPNGGGSKYLFSASGAEDGLERLRGIATVIVGVNTHWRTGNNGGIRPDWRPNNGKNFRDVMKHVDFIQPWTVMSYRNNGGADTYYRAEDGRFARDVEWGRDNNVGIMPVIWPGFSWRNKKDGKANEGGALGYNSVPRAGGAFFWNQAYRVIEQLRDFGSNVGGANGRENVKVITVAMFDEIDEGTAIFKLETNAQKTPRGSNFDQLAEPVPGTNNKTARFVTNVGPQSDRYLWLTKRIRRALLNPSLNDPDLPTNYPN